VVLVGLVATIEAEAVNALQRKQRLKSIAADPNETRCFIDFLSDLSLYGD
jgi:hypothetical protein